MAGRMLCSSASSVHRRQSVDVEEWGCGFSHLPLIRENTLLRSHINQASLGNKSDWCWWKEQKRCPSFQLPHWVHLCYTSMSECSLQMQTMVCKLPLFVQLRLWRYSPSNTRVKESPLIPPTSLHPGWNFIPLHLLVLLVLVESWHYKLRQSFSTFKKRGKKSISKLE